MAAITICSDFGASAIKKIDAKSLQSCLTLCEPMNRSMPDLHEIKTCLLLGRKVLTNLDSIFKSRDINLLTKLHLVKAMVFPVVMYGCESWTVKKAERRRIDAFDLWCWRGLLRRLQVDPTSPS